MLKIFLKKYKAIICKITMQALKNSVDSNLLKKKCNPWTITDAQRGVPSLT